VGSEGAHLAGIGLDGVVLRVLLEVSVSGATEGEASRSGLCLLGVAKDDIAMLLKNAGFAFRRPNMGGIGGGGWLTTVVRTVVRFMVRFWLHSVAFIFVVIQYCGALEDNFF
jgi:hypothetical protein